MCKNRCVEDLSGIFEKHVRCNVTCNVRCNVRCNIRCNIRCNDAKYSIIIMKVHHLITGCPTMKKN